MRFKIAAPITGILAVTGTVLSIGLDATSALGQTPSTIVTPPNASPSQCWNNTAGIAKSGNADVGPHTLILSGVPLNQVNENRYDGMCPICA